MALKVRAHMWLNSDADRGYQMYAQEGWCFQTNVTHQTTEPQGIASGYIFIQNVIRL